MRTTLAALLALAASAWLAYGNLHSDDQGIVVGLIGLAAFASAFLQPRAAWRWALIAGVGVPAGELWSGGIRRDVFFIAALTLAVAFAGAYVAVAIQNVSRAFTAKSGPSIGDKR